MSGYPVPVVNRVYTCKGNARNVGSIRTLRLRTNAQVLELSGVVPDGTWSVQTMIVDGALVTARILSGDTGVPGGWAMGTLRIEFSTQRTRDIWLETFMYVAYIRIGATDTLFAVNDTADPQLTAVGDSYLQVTSEVFGNAGAVALGIGGRLGLRKILTDSIGGTGYWNSGGNLGNLNDRLAGHAADGSQIYLVMAGLNDPADLLAPGNVSWPPQAVYEASVRNYLQGLRAARLTALIVVTSPFCPIPPMSDSSFVSNPGTNGSGLGDFLYRAQVTKQAVQALTGPWIYIDVLMGGGWLNSSGASGDVTGLQWLTGGTPGAGTSSSYKPGNTLGGGGGGFGGIASVPVVSGGQYSQAPDLLVAGGSGTGALLYPRINAAGSIYEIDVRVPGSGYSSGAGLPAVTIDPTYQITPAVLGAPVLLVGTNANGQYPLPSFAPPGTPLSALNNIYTMLGADLTHPSPLGAEYLAQRLAQNIYDGVMAL